MNNMSEQEFLQLIMGLESSGWMTLGKIANPLTGETEKNLQAAHGIINALLMLKEKTKGNLTKSEESLLNSAIQNLQLNYIEESKKPEQKDTIKTKEEITREGQEEKSVNKEKQMNKENS